MTEIDPGRSGAACSHMHRNRIRRESAKGRGLAVQRASRRGKRLEVEEAVKNGSPAGGRCSARPGGYLP